MTAKGFFNSLKLAVIPAEAGIHNNAPNIEAGFRLTNCLPAEEAWPE